MCSKLIKIYTLIFTLTFYSNTFSQENITKSGSIAEAAKVLNALREKHCLKEGFAVPEISNKNEMIIYCLEETIRKFVGTGYLFYTMRRLWNDPLFQYVKPITHTVGSEVYTVTEEVLYNSIPETALIWNENWR